MSLYSNMSTVETEKGGPAADPLTLVDKELAQRRDPDDYESSTSEALEKKDSLVASRKRTRASAVTDDDDDETETELSRTTTRTSVRRPWYRRLNPLKRRRKPPVPDERTVSPEYRASWLSRLTFQWMAPMMRVSRPPILAAQCGWRIDDYERKIRWLK